jgi:hypothetical protein
MGAGASGQGAKTSETCKLVFGLDPVFLRLSEIVSEIRNLLVACNAILKRPYRSVRR